MFVCCECCVLSGRDVCDRLITRLEESYRLWCVVVCDLETSKMRRPWPALGLRATKNVLYYFFWADPQFLNFMCRPFGTPCSILIGGVSKKKRFAFNNYAVLCIKQCHRTPKGNLSKCCTAVLTCICLRSHLFRMTLGTVPHHPWRHTGAIVRYWYVYRVSRDAFRSF
jgi:hypothetical protein